MNAMDFTMNTVWINSWGTKSHWQARTIEQIRVGLHMGARIFYLPLDAEIRTRKMHGHSYLHRDDKSQLRQ